MGNNVQIVLKSKDWIDDKGEKMIFKIPFKQLVLMLKEATHTIAKDDKTSLRLYASNAYTSLKLLSAVLGEDVEEKPKEAAPPIEKKRTYKGRVCGMQPSDEVLLDFKKNGFTQKKIAALYGVQNSTVSNWYTKMKKKG